MNITKNLLLTVLFSLFALSNVVAADFYWVGNSGNWNNASNWSNTSGGNGGIGIPTQNDDVFFDKKSFKKGNSITVQGLAACKNFTWTNTKNTTFKSLTNASLTINGNLHLNEFYTNEFYGKTIFTSNQLQTNLFFDRSTFLGDIEFNGNGSWRLQSNLTTTDSNFIYLEQGELIINNITVFSGGIGVSGSLSKRITATDAVIYVHQKMILNNAPDFSFIRNNSNVIINKKAIIQLGVFNENEFTFSQKFTMKNVCGTIPLTVTLTVLTNFNGFGESCVGNCDGIVFVSYTGGVGPFTTLWTTSDPNNGATTDTIFNVCSGNVGANITDLGQPTPPFGFLQCNETIQVDAPVPLALTLLGSVSPTCNGDCDGALGVSISFGVPFGVGAPYPLTWTNTPQTTPIITSLCANPYAISIVDANGCSLDSTFVLTEPPVITFTLDSTNISCFGNCSGDAMVSNILGGNGIPYTFSWSNPGGSSNSISNLCVGTYVVTVSDDSLCFSKDSVIITQIPQMQIDTSSIRPSCGGDSDGSITVTVTTGGTGPFTHNWSTGFSETIAVATSSTISSLSVGIYCDTIVDANGCDTIICFTLTEPDTVLTSSTVSNITCNGFCDGKITTIPSGGTPSYTFVWDSIPNAGGFTTFDSIVNLCPGTYFVTVTDNNNCSVSDTIIVSEPPPLVVNPNFTNITCPGFNDGTATANPTGGTGNPAVDFSYLWTGPPCNLNPGNTQSIGSLCPGTYIVTITDSSGCTATDSVIITEPNPLSLTTTVINESCFGACDGTVVVTVVGGTPNYTFLWTSNPSGQVANGQGTDSIFGLCPGDYNVIVTDLTTCSSNITATVSPAVPIIDNLVTTNITCNGDCNGTATISPTGGLAPYTVSWDGAAPIGNILAGGSETTTGLCITPNPHTALITDANNCTRLVNFGITEPLLLTTSTTQNNISCFGVCDGDAITAPLGGIAPYTFNWNKIPAPFVGNGQGSDSVSALCDGTYFVTITDDSLCTVNDTIIIIEPNEIFPNVDSTNITCNGLNDGTAISIPTGGAPGYSFSWTGPAPFSSNSQSIGPLAPGQYTVTVTDTNNCTATETITIIDPQPITVNANATAASCGAVCDGIALATVNGGTPGYTYNIGGASQSSPMFTGLCAGTYTITVTDTNGCTASDTTVINPLITITINPTIVGISCNGVCDGTATVFPIGGTLPYTYLWNVPPPNTDSIVTGLCSGFAVVTVTDALGCVTTDSINMPVDPTVLQTGATLIQPVSCANACDAIVTHSPTGGVPPYTSVWSLPFGNDTNNVCPTFAVITITDANNCIQSDTIVITEPTQIIPNDVVVNVQCFGDSTGSITLNPTGGAGGIYTYVWTGPVIGSGISTNNLPAGIYTITITDSNGCFVLITDTITEPPVLSANPIGIDISCNGLCDGIMAVTVNGGVTPYSFNWGNSSPPTLNATGDTLFNVCAPFLTNSVTIIDSNLCSLPAITITINNPAILDANVTGTPIGCDGICSGTAVSTPIGGTAPYQFLWSGNTGSNSITNPGLSNLCIGNYLVTVTDTNGCIDTVTYTVTAPPALNVTLDSTNITCNGDNNGTATITVNNGTAPFTFSWVGGCLAGNNTNSSINNLCPGIYTITVTDSNNCVFIGSVNITEPQPITDSTVVVGANCGVNDGSIVIFISGGTPPYSHSWNTGNIADTNSVLTGLGAGFYTDTVTDAAGCVAIFTVAVTNPTGPSGITATVNDATCFGTCDGSLNAIVIGGTGPYTYAWTGPNGFVGTNDSTQTGLCAGIYNLTLTETSTGCILATNIVVGEADSIIANATFTNTSCNGVCDGTASVAPTGGTGSYTYLWSNNGSTASSVSGLCAGPVSVIITDFNNCTKVVNFNINTPTPLTITSSTTPTNCNGDCNGTATANPTGGTITYTYQWNDPAAQTTQTATRLCAGIYIVTVTDSKGCSGNDTITVNEPTIIIDNVVTSNSTCGNSDGTANVCASSGGTGTHTYNWPTLGSNSCSVSGLSAGTYPVEITDANSCIQSFLITISDVNGPTIIVNATNASCDGVCDGQATVTAIGTANFSYLWQTGGQVTPTVTGLCAGNYTAQVTDGNNCVTTQPVIITDNIAITATVTTIDATCNGVCNGSVLVVPNGGLPPYRYSWTGGNAAGQTINAVGGLCAGNYTVIITDFLGCSLIQNVTINEPNVLTVSVAGIAANCNGACDGSATANPTGGNGLYTYLWSNNATTQTITALCAGNYTVTVTDINGCTEAGSVTIGDGIPITATITSIDITPSGATCAICDGSITVINPAGGAGGPYTYLWSPGGQVTPTISNLCPGAYSLTITDNVGCTQIFNVLINNQNGQASLVTQANGVSCFGSCDGLAFTTPVGGLVPVALFQWDDPNLTTNDTATALCAGFYTVIMQDVLGCITVDSVTVPEPPQIIANITSSPPTCAGLCTGTATVTPTGGVGTLTIQWGSSAGNQTTPIATGLCAGTHIVTITDNTGCSITDSITLVDPPNISITISSTTPTCFGDCDGTAIANASGGNPGYQYSWNTNPIEMNSLIGGLCAGTYIVTVTDNNNCTDTASVQVINPPVLTTTSNQTPTTCNNICDGSITTTPVGGVFPYTYIWSNGDTTQTTSSTLCPGIYTVTIVDANNCTINDTITLVAPIILDAAISPTSPDCGLCNGSITSTPTGSVGPFDFVWTNPTASVPLIQTDLAVATSTIIAQCAGTYNLQVTDQATGCVSNYIIILNSTNGPILTMTATNETCISACDGTATATPNGGTAPFTYSWSPTNPTDINQTATNLCVGLYTVTVTDSNLCIISDTISITTNSLNLSITSVVPETCFGDCDGSATVAVSGGIPNYTFNWTPTSQITAQATALCVGNYVVTVTDSANCKDSISTNITGPNILTVIASVNKPITCNGRCNGAAIANVVGGTQNYTFAWNDPLNQTTQIATGLCNGTYIVTVTDGNGCTAMDTIVISEPLAILANATPITPNCGNCDGSITLAPTGGTSPYTFLWTTPTAPPSPQPVTASIINLCAGAYTLVITDSTGCEANFNFPLSNVNAPIPNTTVKNISCNGICDGEISSAATGGTAPYTYFWSPTGTNNPVITGLCVGQYTLNVTDSLGCVGVAIDSVTQPAILQANINASNITCNGICDGWAISNTIGGTTPYTYNWTPGNLAQDSISNLCANTYIVTVTDSNNCTVTDSIAIIEPTLITATSTKIDVTCTSNCDGSATSNPSNGTGPYTFQWNGNTALGQAATETGLCFGLNTVVIIDRNGCSITDTINLGATDTVLADAGLDTSICLGTPINLSGIPSGTFTSVEWFELPSITSLGTTNSITTTPTSIGVICYAFQVTGACIFTDTVCITVDPLPIADAGLDVSIFENENTTLNATGGTTYNWTPSIGLSDTTIFNPIASPEETTTYFVTVTSVSGCIATDSVIVTVLPNIKFPDGISPNGDGKNDVWIIDFIEQFPENVVEIYNRWGELLFHADGYQQDWDGTYNGKELPIGTYYYIIDLHDESIKPFTGPLTILR